MTKKVNFFDKLIRVFFYQYFSIITAILSVIVIFFDIPQEWRVVSGVVFLVICIFLYIFIWIIANRKEKIKLNISGTPVHIKTGDFFEQNGLKVVPFNEFYDTKVDDLIITHESLNGQYIDKYWQNNINELDKNIYDNKTLKDKVVEQQVKREGKNTKFSIGSIVVIDSFVLTAFTKFDKDNQAKLTINDYLEFLMTFWNEINKVYAQKKVTVPIFGSGITRFTNGIEDIDENELLRIMIWTFKVSKIKFEYPADLTVIVHQDKIDKINVFSLKEEEE